MKFISKLSSCLVMENVAFFNPHLRKLIFKIYTQKNLRIIPTKKRNETSKKHREKKNEKIWYIGHTDSEHSIFWCPILTKIICFQDDSIIFLVSFEVFLVIKRRCKGPLRVQTNQDFGSSQNHPKSIGI